MVSFKLGKEIEKDVLRLQLSWDWDKEKILGPHEIRFLMGTQNFFFVPGSWQDEKHLTCCYQKLRGNPKHAN